MELSGQPADGSSAVLRMRATECTTRKLTYDVTTLTTCEVHAVDRDVPLATSHARVKSAWTWVCSRLSYAQSAILLRFS